jgi:hypothetical protein
MNTGGVGEVNSYFPSQFRQQAPHYQTKGDFYHPQDSQEICESYLNSQLTGLFNVSAAAEGDQYFHDIMTTKNKMDPHAEYRVDSSQQLPLLRTAEHWLWM